METATFKYYGGGTEDLRYRTGQTVTVLYELDDTQRDSEVGRMYRVRFGDGLETDVFEEELTNQRRRHEPTRGDTPRR